MRKKLCIHEEKKLTFLLIMSVKDWRVGGAKALADMTSKNILMEAAKKVIFHASEKRKRVI